SAWRAPGSAGRRDRTLPSASRQGGASAGRVRALVGNRGDVGTISDSLSGRPRVPAVALCSAPRRSRPGASASSLQGLVGALARARAPNLHPARRVPAPSDPPDVPLVTPRLHTCSQALWKPFLGALPQLAALPRHVISATSLHHTCSCRNQRLSSAATIASRASCPGS